MLLIRTGRRLMGLLHFDGGMLLFENSGVSIFARRKAFLVLCGQ